MIPSDRRSLADDLLTYLDAADSADRLGLPLTADYLRRDAQAIARDLAASDLCVICGPCAICGLPIHETGWLVTVPTYPPACVLLACQPCAERLAGYGWQGMQVHVSVDA